MFRRVVAFFIFWKIVILIFTLSAVSLLRFNLPAGFSLDYLQTSPYVLGVWANFDGASYLNIARDGYEYPLFAYFPLLPLLISIIHKLTTFSLLASGLLITNLAFFLSLFILYKLVLLDFERKVAWRTLILLLIFPASFFYGAVYTESLYFLFSTLSFYYARKNRWLLAGLFGLVAGVDRLVGISLIIALLIEWFMQKKDKKNLIRKFIEEKVYFLFLIPLGIVFYGLYLQLNFGDFLLFQKSMTHWGQGQFIFPLQVLVRYAKILVFVPKNLAYFIAILELVSVFFYLFLSFYVLKKVRISYGLWMIVSLLIPTFTGTLQSMPRYILQLFPAFIALALMTKNKKVFLVVAAFSLILQFILVVLFTRGYFVA